MTADDVNLSKFLVPLLAYVQLLPFVSLVIGTVTRQTQGSITCMFQSASVNRVYL